MSGVHAAREEFIKRLHADFDSIVACFGALKAEAPTIAAAADILTQALWAGNKIMFCGNGGSAADSQHLAAELMGRYLKDRAPLPALALTVDTSALTAIGNDYSYDLVFARQLSGIGKSGDVLVGISTSGNSRNVIAAVETARKLGISTIGMTGKDGGKLAPLCDLCIRVPASTTNRIQEMHIAIGHALCGAVESRLFSDLSSRPQDDALSTFCATHRARKALKSEQVRKARKNAHLRARKRDLNGGRLMRA